MLLITRPHSLLVLIAESAWEDASQQKTIVNLQQQAALEAFESHTPSAEFTVVISRWRVWLEGNHSIPSVSLINIDQFSV